MALQELRVNKTRTFLSLLGVVIGIFCIIAVFTLTKSLEINVRNEMSSMGRNVIYVERWPWDGGDGEWWKYVQRPAVNYDEFKALQQRVHNASAMAYVYESGNKIVEHGDDYMENVNMLSVTDGFDQIQKIRMAAGRFFTPAETTGNGMIIILGNNIWEGLFISAHQAIGQKIDFAGRRLTVVGTFKHYGTPLLVGFDYDNSVLLPYSAAKRIVNDRNSWISPYIMVKSLPHAGTAQLKEEVRGAMRAIRRLKPTEEDNFAMNEQSMMAGPTEKVLGKINLGGIVIGIFALIVGAFGIANIMFVSVKERTNIIGIKKAIGARRAVIMEEFLIEAVLICLIGGVLGMLLVFIVTKLIASFVFFNIYMTTGIISFGLSISIGTGVLAGIIPALSASRLDPVVAIRS